MEVSETYQTPPPMGKPVVPSSQTTTYDVAPPPVSSNGKPRMKVAMGPSSLPASEINQRKTPKAGMEKLEAEKKHLGKLEEEVLLEQKQLSLKESKERLARKIANIGGNSSVIQEKEHTRDKEDQLRNEKKLVEEQKKKENELTNDLIEEFGEEYKLTKEAKIAEELRKLAVQKEKLGNVLKTLENQPLPKTSDGIHSSSMKANLQKQREIDLKRLTIQVAEIGIREKEDKIALDELQSSASLLTLSPSASVTTSTAVLTSSASPSASIAPSPYASITSSPSASIAPSSYASITSSPSVSIAPSSYASITSLPSASIAPSSYASITSSPSASNTPSPNVSITSSPSASYTLSPSASTTPSHSNIPTETSSPRPTSSFELLTPTPSTSLSQSSPLTSLGNFNLDGLFQDAQLQIGNFTSSQEKSAKENAQNAQQKQVSTQSQPNFGPVSQLVDRGNLLAQSSSVSKTQNLDVNVTDNNRHASNQVATEAANEAVENVLQAAQQVSSSSYMGKQIAEILKLDEAGARNEVVAIEGDLANSTNGNASITKQKENMNAERENLVKELDQLDTEPKNITTRLRRLVIVLDMARYDHRIMMLEQQMKLNEAELAWLKKEVSESQRSAELSKNQQTLNEKLTEASTDQQKNSLMQQLSAIQDELSWLSNQSKTSHTSRGEDEELHQRLVVLKKTRKAKDAELIVLDEKLRTKFANETGNSSISDALIAKRTILANEIAQLRKEELDVQAKRLKVQNSAINAVYQPSQVPSPTPTSTPPPCDAICLEKRAAAEAERKKRELLALEAKKARDKLAQERTQRRREEARKWLEMRKRLHERNIERKGLGLPTIPYTPVLTVRELPNTIEGVEAELKLNAMKMANETKELTDAKGRNDTELIQAYEKRIQIITDRQERLTLHLENLRKEEAAKIEEEKRKQDELEQLRRDGLITIEQSGNISLPQTLTFNFTTENETVTTANYPMDVSGVTEAIVLLNNTVMITRRELTEARRKQDSYLIEKLKKRIDELSNRRMQLTTLLEKMIEDEKQREKERQDAIERTMNERLLRIEQLEKNNSDLAVLHSKLKSKQSQEKQKIVKCFKDTIVDGKETSTEVPCDNEMASTQ